MRCEVCGAPINGDDTVCELCSSKRMSWIPEPPDTTEVKESSEIQDKWGNILPPIGKRESLPLPKSGMAFNVPSSIVLEGKYLLRNEIGRGAMGTVFLAEDTTLQRQVAVKFLRPEFSNSPEYAERFRQEAVGMAAIRDNNVAQIYAYGKYGNIPYFVMEYLKGETVENTVDTHNRRGIFMPLQDVVSILIQSVSGLAAIHRSNVVHRDIKPANIMLTDDPMRAVIMDFGLVRSVKMEDEVRALAGTPAYIAPELVEGISNADRSPLTDIYSMGSSAYEILTGSLPFSGDNWVEILRMHITEIPAFPSERRPGIPDELDEIILRAMSKDPKERYQNCDDFLEDLLAIEQIFQSDGQRNGYSSNSRASMHRRPSYQKLQSIPPRAALRSTPRIGRGRLLVVDPNSDFRTLVHDTAKKAVPGCRIQSAADGDMALEIIGEFLPHVLVIDLSLPEVNGLEVIATLRGDQKYNDLCIVVVADRGGRREADILAGLNVSHFLTKPVDTNTLASVLRQTLEPRLRSQQGSSPQ
ncbi:MAG: protein kinase [Proteobacteria bacterium]|nr:protein kinase [Pseudomonadota bacterium]